MKIVVGTDFSPVSNRAFEFSLSFSKRLGAEVIAVFVKDADDLAIAAREQMKVRRRDLDRLPGIVNQFIDDQFQRLLKKTKTNDVSVRIVKVEGTPWERILKVAQSEKADFIITGSRSRSSVSVMFLGSTAKELIAHSTCPVITINKIAKL
jgi:nucleotide-binding universal stress UspA family protein